MFCYGIVQKAYFDPLISIPGVKIDVNTVNIQKTNPFVSTPGMNISLIKGVLHGMLLITKIWLGVAYAVNVNKQPS